MSLTQLLADIQANNVRQLVADRETVRVGPFLAAFHPTSDLVWLNYATPVETTGDGSVTPATVAELRAAFGARRRTLRFEFIEALHPGLAAALEGVGLSLQLRAPLMVCGPANLQPCSALGMAVRDVDRGTDDATLAEFIRVTRRGFGVEPIEPTDSDLAEQRALLFRAAQRLAYAELDGRTVAVGVLQASAELGGVATLPEFRRRGAAAAVSAHLVKRLFDAGGQVVWLSAGDDAARAVYRRIGFADAGAVLNYIGSQAGY